jgi:hypothetical protein
MRFRKREPPHRATRTAKDGQPLRWSTGRHTTGSLGRRSKLRENPHVRFLMGVTAMVADDASRVGRRARAPAGAAPR